MRIHVDRKVTIWKRNKYDIEEEDLVDFLDYIKEHEEVSEKYDDDFIEREDLYETEEWYGESAIEVYDEKDKLLLGRNHENY
jgi:hypothetical protein